MEIPKSKFAFYLDITNIFTCIIHVIMQIQYIEVFDLTNPIYVFCCGLIKDIIIIIVIIIISIVIIIIVIVIFIITIVIIIIIIVIFIIIIIKVL